MITTIVHPELKCMHVCVSESLNAVVLRMFFLTYGESLGGTDDSHPFNYDTIHTYIHTYIHTLHTCIHILLDANTSRVNTKIRSCCMYEVHAAANDM